MGVRPRFSDHLSSAANYGNANIGLAFAHVIADAAEPYGRVIAVAAGDTVRILGLNW